MLRLTLLLNRLISPTPLALAVLCSLLAGKAQAAEGIITSGAMTGDADSGVNSAKTYLSLGNVVGGNVTVNGVTFLGTGTSGTGWALSNMPNTFPAGSGGNHTTTFGGSTIDDLFDGFQYNGNPGTLTLSGLTAGQTYVTTLYNEAWGLGADRTQTITSGDGASLIYNEDALEASVVRYTFVATGATATLNFTPRVPATTMHVYGLSNEQVFNNTWSVVSGNSWNTAANWSTGTIPSTIGSNASFSSQVSATSVTLDAPTTTGHVQFLGTGAYTVSGANTLTLQTDSGGVSVLSAETGGLHTIGTDVQINSPLAKFGAGTVTLGGAVTGTNKGVTIGNGTLRVASSSADISSLGNIDNSGTFELANGGTQKLDAIISGTGGLTKSGAGTLTLGGQQGYTGPTVISGGTLKLSAPIALTIANGSFQTYTSLASGSYGYNPAGATWTFNAASGIALNGSPWYSPTNHDGTAAGYLQNSAGAFSQSITVVDAGFYNFNFQGAARAGVNGPNGVLFQVDGLTVKTFAPGEFSDATWQNYVASVNLTAGAHTIGFVGNNILGGDKSTAIDAVTAGIGGRLPTSTALNLTASGATLDLSGYAQAVGSLTGAAGSSVINDSTFTVGSAGTSTVFDGGISGAGSFIKTGAGVLSLGGANTYAGTTTVNAGTLKMTGGSLPAASALNLSASGATFDLNGTTTSVGSLIGVSGSSVTLGGGNLTVGGNGTSTSFDGLISGNGTLTKAGAGKFTLTAAQSYSGATTVSNGTLKTTLANTSVGPVAVATGASWDLGVANHTISGLTGAGNVIRSGVISTGADGSALISASKNYVQKLDFGNNGGATVNGVEFNSAGTSGTGYSLTGVTSLFGGADTGGYDQLIGDFFYGGNPGTLTFGGLTVGQIYEAVIYTKVGSWVGRLQNATFDEDGAGPISNVLSSTEPGNVGYYAYRFAAPSTNVTLTMAPITPANTFHWFGASLENVSTSSPTLTIGDANNYAFTGLITGPTALVKQGSGIQELSGSSTYVGGTTISGGSLLARNAAALGTGAVSIASGANFLTWWNTGNSTVSNAFTLNGLGGFSPGGNKAAIYADGGPAGGFAEYTLAGNITLAATSNLGGNTSNNLRVSGAITGAGGLTKGGGRTDESNTLILANTLNDYAGETLITKGTVKLGNSETIPHGAGKGGVSISAGTTLDLGGFSETINSLTGAGTITSTASVSTPVYFTDDASSGISSSKTYTHALDFAEGTTVSINGVTFTGAGLTGSNWSLTGASPSAGNGATGATGNVSRLLTNFYYNGNPATMTLSGLTPGVTYETRLYERYWGGDRTQLFTINGGSGTGTMIYNEDLTTTPSFIAFRFTANASGLATITTNQIGTGSYHWYGATNEVVADPVLTVGDANNSTFSGTITGPTGVTKQGNGELTLSGANTYTGKTNLVGGSLLGGGNNVFAAGSAFTLSGGKLGSGGFDQAVGPLMVAAGTSVIDLTNADSSSILTFSGISSTAWIGTLQVWNWSGTLWTPGGGDQLVFSNLTNIGNINLNNIQFFEGSGEFPIGSGAAFVGNELVPVPEINSLLTALGLCLTICRRESRRRNR